MASTSDYPTLWDSARTAGYLDVPVRTLDQWAWQGIGPVYFKIGRHRRYDPAAVQSWLETRRGPRPAA